MIDKSVQKVLSDSPLFSFRKPAQVYSQSMTKLPTLQDYHKPTSIFFSICSINFTPNSATFHTAVVPFHPFLELRIQAALDQSMPIPAHQNKALGNKKSLRGMC